MQSSLLCHPLFFPAVSFQQATPNQLFETEIFFLKDHFRQINMTLLHSHFKEEMHFGIKGQHLGKLKLLHSPHYSETIINLL